MSDFENITPALDTIIGQVQNAIPGRNLLIRRVNANDEYPAYLLRFQWGYKTLSLLVVAEANIKHRRREEDPDNATWLLREPTLPGVLKMTNCVVVCYGYANQGGEIAEESAGNQRKSNYRRLAYTTDISEQSDYGYDEIPHLFTEKNIRLAWEREPLEDVREGYSL